MYLVSDLLARTFPLIEARALGEVNVLVLGTMLNYAKDDEEGPAKEWLLRSSPVLCLVLCVHRRLVGPALQSLDCFSAVHSSAYQGICGL